MSQPKVTIYTSAFCGYCSAAKRLLDAKMLSYEEQRVDLDPSLRDEMEERSQRYTVPQIFIGATHVGGYDELAALERADELDELIARETP